MDTRLPEEAVDLEEAPCADLDEEDRVAQYVHTGVEEVVVPEAEAAVVVEDEEEEEEEEGVVEDVDAEVPEAEAEGLRTISQTALKEPLISMMILIDTGESYQKKQRRN